MEELAENLYELESVYTEEFSEGLMLRNNKISRRSGKFQSGEYQNRGKNARFSLRTLWCG